MRRLAEVIAVGLVCAASFASSAHLNADPDLWGHLKYGELVLNTGSWPTVDIYSYTALGRPWVDHEWLCQAVMTLLFQHTGDTGLILVKLLLAGMIGLILYLLCRIQRAPPLVAAAMVAIAMLTISPGMTVRPQLVSYLLFSLWILILQGHLLRRTRLLPLLPITAMVWANLHGGVLIGIALLLMATVWGAASRLLVGDRDVPIGHLAFWTGLSCLALLVNPYGAQLLSFLFTFTSAVPRTAISEWAPVTLLTLDYPRFKILVVFFLVSLLAPGKRKAGGEICFIIMTMVFGFLHVRHVPFFAIAATPFVASRLPRVFDHLRQRWFPGVTLTRTSQGVVMLCIAAIAVVQVEFGLSRYRQTGFHLQVNPRSFPVEAVRFIKRQRLGGRLLLPYDWGQYAIWHLYPQCLVSGDGRFDNVNPEFFVKYFSGEELSRWGDLLVEHPPDLVLSPPYAGTERLLAARGWKIVHRDATALVWDRVGPAETGMAGGISEAAEAAPVPPPALTRFP